MSITILQHDPLEYKVIFDGLPHIRFTVQIPMIVPNNPGFLTEIIGSMHNDGKPLKLAPLDYELTLMVGDEDGMTPLRFIQEHESEFLEVMAEAQAIANDSPIEATPGMMDVATINSMRGMFG